MENFCVDGLPWQPAQSVFGMFSTRSVQWFFENVDLGTRKEKRKKKQFQIRFPDAGGSGAKQYQALDFGFPLLRKIV